MESFNLLSLENQVSHYFLNPKLTSLLLIFLVFYREYYNLSFLRGRTCPTLLPKKKERKVRGHQIAQNCGLPTREPQDRARAIGEFYVKNYH
jgi:hypothetical protein